jgi:hypothetical protein
MSWTEPLDERQSEEMRKWLRCVSISGSIATLAYVLLVVLPGPDALAVAVAFSFAASLSVGSVAIWQVLRASGQDGPVPMFAAFSNVLAGALFVSMVVVQVAIKSVQDPPDEAIRSVYWGLDVAWDLYIGAGTLGFATVCWRAPLFRMLSLPGVVIAVALIALNLAAFPEPPSSAGLVDVGPFVGLWYAAVTVRAMFLLRATKAISPEPTAA